MKEIVKDLFECIDDGADAICITTNGTNCVEIQGSFPLPVYAAGSTYTNITTSTNTVIKAAAGTFAGLVVNSAGPTGSSATVYDNTACSGTRASTETPARAPPGSTAAAADSR